MAEFVVCMKLRSFVAMHRVDYHVRIPSQEFLSAAKNIPIWSPTKPGEHRSFDDERFYGEV